VQPIAWTAIPVSQSQLAIQTIRLSGAGQIPEEKFIPISPFIIENEGGIHPVS
jgi:hypothetical protein